MRVQFVNNLIRINSLTVKKKKGKKKENWQQKTLRMETLVPNVCYPRAKHLRASRRGYKSALKASKSFFAVSSRSPALRRRDVGSTPINSGTGATLLEPNCVVISALSLLHSGSLLIKTDPQGSTAPPSGQLYSQA